MDQRPGWLMAAIVGALCGAFVMAVRGPEHSVFLFLMAAYSVRKAQTLTGPTG